MHVIRLHLEQENAAGILYWQEPQTPPQLEPSVLQAKRWRDYFTRPCRDSDAQLVEENSHDPPKAA
jgi:hypothetical protein